MKYLLPILLFFIIGCQNPIKESNWLLTLHLNNTDSIIFPTTSINKLPIFNIINAQETLYCRTEITDTSYKIKLPVFESFIKLKKESDKKYFGFWKDESRKGNYKIPVTLKSASTNLIDNSNSSVSIAGKWKVEFSPKSVNEYPAIGNFEQIGNKLTGTFLTETGDYRFLSGIVTNHSFYLQTFDGSHAFLFKGTIKNDSIYGTFLSGNHWQESWVGVRDENFRLRNPDSLSKQTTDVNFKIISTEKDSIKYPSEPFKNKVVIVQIMGSWCPNCLDETRYLSSLYNLNKSNGLEVISIAFERKTEVENALKAINKHKVETGAQYTFGYGGFADKTNVQKQLPFIDKFYAYPTSIYIDKKGKVRKIQSGFNGPGTSLYDSFVLENDKFIQTLLDE